MKNKQELSYKDLKMSCNPDVFTFDTTADLEPIQEGIGQERGIKALEFGLQVDVKGYNLYLEGPSGVGKTLYTKNYLNKIALKKNLPSLTNSLFLMILRLKEKIKSEILYISPFSSSQNIFSINSFICKPLYVVFYKNILLCFFIQSQLSPLKAKLHSLIHIYINF